MIKKLDWVQHTQPCPYDPAHAIVIAFPAGEPSEIRQPCGECHNVVFVTVGEGVMTVETQEAFYKRIGVTCQS